MPIDIRGKQYVTVAERIAAFHADHKGAALSIETEIIPLGDQGVTVRATIVVETDKGATRRATGHATSAYGASSVEGQAPLEVAETSSVGRALAFLGYLSDGGIASADEMRATPARTPTRTSKAVKAPDPAPDPARRAQGQFYAFVEAAGLDPRDSASVHLLVGLDCDGVRGHADGDDPKCHALRDQVESYADPVAGWAAVLAVAQRAVEEGGVYVSG